MFILSCIFVAFLDWVYVVKIGRWSKSVITRLVTLYDNKPYVCCDYITLTANYVQVEIHVAQDRPNKT